LMLCAGTAALAQGAPQPAPTPIPVPTLAPAASRQIDPIIRSAAGIVTDIIGRERTRLANNSRGTVSYYKKFDMQIQTGIGGYRAIHLHQGTVINPRGATPGAGTTVEVSGQSQPDGSLNADYINIIQ
jgi:hypothetical protein